MAVVSVSKDQTLTTVFGTTMTMRSSPMAVGGANYGEFTLNIESNFATGGNASLTWQVEGSNDGVNFPIAAKSG